MNKKIRIGITIGDPSGIGPEVTLEALDKFRLPLDCEIIILGDRLTLSKSGLKKKNKFNLIDLNKVSKKGFKMGVLTKESGLVSFTYLKKAVEFLKKGKINALVTAPVSKEAISLNRIRFCGHTEFLASQFRTKDFVMMFVSRNLKVSLVTRHIALNDVSKNIKKENIAATISLTYSALKNYFGINNPRLAVAGLNPHASEDGLMGDEEDRVIKPVIAQLKNKYKTIYGPLPADTLFKPGFNKEFDAVICMYHDQGLIPFKMLDFFEGVNLTLGLPFIRTSPVHGTAFNIAGKNKADYHSMLEAVKLAYTLTRNKLRN
ncbi:MAG: 4-hydroxythreonine-4-phosphate dehydrogenase PdxA [Candidatus Omnitrophica bacterium]|nr:4-hydroxythreonine-4-phosphate dehydrogenase PdxA [Candidatus Omnitrophota bacterium]MDD5352587.1 4-hydroxythreonine-4-phosphate dehydrogenase PdxA [Candidatus Omnitrophota bacterium]MDD5550185.1 4-hydroxythreonine-4-phosphate dehydrogenase PdxA [Candidatus Omnitrophota bacterium]